MAGCRGCSLSLGRLVPNLHSKYETLENSVSIGALPQGPGSVLWWARPGVGPGTPRSCGHHGGSRPRRASCAVDMGPTPPQVPWHPSSPCRASCQQGLPPGHHVVRAALRFRPQGPSFEFSLPSGSELCERRPGLLRGCPTRRPLGRPRQVHGRGLDASAQDWRLRALCHAASARHGASYSDASGAHVHDGSREPFTQTRGWLLRAAHLGPPVSGAAAPALAQPPTFCTRPRLPDRA